MPFEGKPVREITEADLRQLVQSGLAEHMSLDYKRDLYEDSLKGHREQLLDICMFANAQGGLLLLGIDELRDASGKPTGTPNPAALLGLQHPNPEALLQGYDGRVESCISEQLSIESAAIPVHGERYVFAFRVPNSTSKPHCVTFDKHVYFPSRRERNRYRMDVREIKELAMRTASQLERAEILLSAAVNFESRAGTDINVYFGLTPVFFRDFTVDIKKGNIVSTIGNFNVLGNAYQNTGFSHAGLERRDDGRTLVTLMRNGLVRGRCSIPTQATGELVFYPTAVDMIVRRFVMRAQRLYEIASVSGPMILAVKLSIPQTTLARYGDPFDAADVTVEPTSYNYSLILDTLGEPAETLIRPLADHIHQTFGQEASPNFDQNGAWIARR